MGSLVPLIRDTTFYYTSMPHQLAQRVVARYLQADLHPPLGVPGGPCQVIQRIREEVRTPDMQQQMVKEVSKGDDLSNPEAAKVYELDREAGTGPIRQILIGPHAQYRMDLRRITVRHVQATFSGFFKRLNDLKSQSSPMYVYYAKRLMEGQPIEYEDPKVKLLVIFAMEGRDSAKIITTYWPGTNDPRMPPGGCPV